MTKQGDLTLPSTDESVRALELSRKLAGVLTGGDSVPARFGEASGPTATVELPAAAVRLLHDILEEMGHGNAVALTPIPAELTTRQAADLLNVSRTHLVQLLDQGRIAHRMVGTHRRVLAKDILAYRREMERQRRSTLDELTAYDQELGLQ